MIKTYFFIALAPIRLWTLFPWIRSYSNGFEFTWVFLVLARYWVDEDKEGYEDEEYEV